MAKCLDSDEDSMIYPRFASLHLRNLLVQQEELMRLERELDGDSDQYSFQEHRQSSASSNYKVKLLEVIEEKLSNYRE